LLRPALQQFYSFTGHIPNSSCVKEHSVKDLQTTQPRRMKMRSPHTDTEDFVTIIAPSTGEAMQQFKAQGLDLQGYSIAGRIGRHRFSLVDGAQSSELFPGQEMIAATFSRRVGR
jgi:hypothetical protein